MVRRSKQEKKRSQSPRKYQVPSTKTGSKKDHLPLGFKEHSNAVNDEELVTNLFIPKIK